MDGLCRDGVSCRLPTLALAGGDHVSPVLAARSPPRASASSLPQEAGCARVVGARILSRSRKLLEPLIPGDGRRERDWRRAGAGYALRSGDRIRLMPWGRGTERLPARPRPRVASVIRSRAYPCARASRPPILSVAS